MKKKFIFKKNCHQFLNNFKQIFRKKMSLLLLIINKEIFYVQLVVVALLVEQLLPTSEVSGSNPAKVGKICNEFLMSTMS